MAYFGLSRGTDPVLAALALPDAQEGDGDLLVVPDVVEGEVAHLGKPEAGGA
jgi:hypothetical protein